MTEAGAISGVKIRHARESDMPALVAVYNKAVRETTATWDTTEHSVDGRCLWLRQRRAQGLPVLVAVTEQDEFLGYSSLSPFRPHTGYKLTAEHGIYLAEGARGRGVGRRLLQVLLEEAKKSGLHCIVACIGSDSEASLRLHKSCGFNQVAYMPQAGCKFGRWLDLVIMQRLIDGPKPLS